MNLGKPDTITNSDAAHFTAASGVTHMPLPEAGSLPPENLRILSKFPNGSEPENSIPHGISPEPAHGGQRHAAFPPPPAARNTEKGFPNPRRPEPLPGSPPPRRPLRDRPQSPDRRGERAAGMDLQPLREALPMAELCAREGLALRRGTAGLVASCPFHEETTPSFTIHDRDPHSAHCYGCGWHGDIFKFWSHRHGLSLSGKGFAEIVRQLSSLCGIMPPRSDVRFSPIPPDRKIPPSIFGQEPPRLPELTPLLPAHAEALIRLRGYDDAGLREAARRGYLHGCDWPLDADGHPGSRSSASWCITDSARRVAQFRRLDGKPYAAGKDREGIKAWSTKGVRWLIGCQDVKPETELVLLVEGGADFLAAWTLIARHALSPASPSLAVCCVFGGTMSIAPECRAMLKGKHVRIIMDVDSPRTVKKREVEIQIRPGTEAAARWSRELTEAGAVVDVYSLEGLVCRKNGEELPVGDLNDLLLMEDAEHAAAAALQLLSLETAAAHRPLHGERALRVGAARAPHPDAAAKFIPGTAPESAAPSMPEAARPSLESLMAANELRALELVLQKLQAGLPLTRPENALAKRELERRAAAQEPPPGGGETDPVISVCEALDVWWVNGGGGVFQVRNGGSQWREIPREDVHAMLQERGISDRPVGGSLLEQNRRCILHIQENRMLDRAIDGLAGFQPGIHDFKSVRILVRKGPLLITPLKGDCPVIHDLLMGALGLDGVEGAASMVQYERFNHWLARAARNVHRPGKVHLNSQIMMLAGPAGAGKSLIQHLILTPMLGGRSADPSRYLFGETSFNEGWVACEHLLIEDPRPNVRTHDRLLFAQMLKALSVNQEHSLHAKGKAEFTVPSRFVVSLTINDDPDSIRILPKLTPDFLDKVMLLKIRHWPLPMPADSPEEKAAFREAIAAELPAYLDYLLSLEVPENLKDPRRRFGVRHYQHPELTLLLSEDSPDSEFLALLDHVTMRLSDSGADRTLWEMEGGWEPEDYLGKHARLSEGPARNFLESCVRNNRRIWVGTALQLHDVMMNCPNPRAWGKVADHNSIQRLLLRLGEDRPDRVCFHRTKAARLWFISAAPPATDDTV